MKTAARWWVLLLPLVLAGAGGAQAPKVKLLMKAEAGQVVRYRSEATVTVEAGGQKVMMEMKETEKVTFTTVAPSGEITMERESESREGTINGQKLPVPERDDEKATITIKPDGSLVAYKSSEGNSDQTKMAVRIFPAGKPVFPAGEVGVGDKWSRDYPANADTGGQAGKAEFELLAFEKVGGVDAVKLKMSYRETQGSPALAGTGTVWVEKSSGDTIQSDMELENVPLGPGGVASGKVHEERIAGGPLGAPTGADGKPIAAKQKTIDEIVKEYEKLPGLFTLYRKREAGRDVVYLELRQEQLERLFFLQATASTGTAMMSLIAGDPLRDILFKFSENGNEQILMVVPNIQFAAAGNSPLARSVKRSFAPAYLESFKIEARQPERKSLLINISDLFRGDIAQVAQTLGGGGSPIPGMPGGPSYSLDRDKTYVATLKAFPENLYIETAYHFTRSGGRPGGIAALFDNSGTLADPRSVPVKVNFNLFQIPENGYRPRIADPRVGYFYTETQDLTDDGRDDQVVRYALRWDVRKADPKAALSPPKEPIVFWIDNAVPLEYRAAVREGLLMWNKAFERVGIQDAIVVKQMPDDAEWDHADMRYNVIRWTTSPGYGYAVALFRVNPLTGQILNAGITVDSSLTRFPKLERREFVDPAAYFAEKAPAAQSAHPSRCEMGAGALEQAWFGHMALSLLAAPGEKIDEHAYTHDFLRAIVAHEMGHVLGLFHNFAASTQFSLADLKDAKKVREWGTVGSVMDYIPFNIAALKQKEGEYWTPTIGRYDFWAIQYGYTTLPAESPEAEEKWLKGIATRGNLPGHAFHNDFVADQFDPNVTRFDLSSDPLAYWTRNLQVSRHLLLNLSQRLPKQGESYWKFTRAFSGLMGQYTQSAALASRYIGGLHVNRNYRGDALEQPVLQPVDGAKQRQALQLLNTYIFAPNAFAFPDSYYKKLTGPPFPSFTSSSGTSDFPIRDQLARTQAAALRRLFSPAVLARMVNNEFKVNDPQKALTLPELFNSVGVTVWSELGGKQRVGSLRRQLQRTHLDVMIGMVVNPTSGAPDDARMLAWDQLRKLKARVTAAKQPAQDEYTRVHLDESLMRINRALNATQTIGGSTPPTNPLLLLLGNGAEAAAERLLRDR